MKDRTHCRQSQQHTPLHVIPPPLPPPLLHTVPTNISIEKLHSYIQVLCQQLRVVFSDNNADSTQQMPDTYRLRNCDGLHLNTRGRKALSDSLVNVIISSRMSVAPPAARCRPQHQQVQHPGSTKVVRIASIYPSLC